MSNDQNKQESIEDVKRHVRQHLMIAVGLAVGTLITIAVSRMDLGNHSINIAIAIGIACIQAFFIAGFFMHLLSEKKLIYSFLIFTAVFFVVQMGITIWSHQKDNIVHVQD